MTYRFKKYSVIHLPLGDAAADPQYGISFIKYNPIEVLRQLGQRLVPEALVIHGLEVFQYIECWYRIVIQNIPFLEQFLDLFRWWYICQVLMKAVSRYCFRQRGVAVSVKNNAKEIKVCHKFAETKTLQQEDIRRYKKVIQRDYLSDCSEMKKSQRRVYYISAIPCDKLST